MPRKREKIPVINNSNMQQQKQLNNIFPSIECKMNSIDPQTEPKIATPECHSKRFPFYYIRFTRIPGKNVLFSHTGTEDRAFSGFVFFIETLYFAKNQFPRNRFIVFVYFRDGQVLNNKKIFFYSLSSFSRKESLKSDFLFYSQTQNSPSSYYYNFFFYFIP